MRMKRFHEYYTFYCGFDIVLSNFARQNIVFGKQLSEAGEKPATNSPARCPECWSNEISRTTFKYQDDTFRGQKVREQFFA